MLFWSLTLLLIVIVLGAILRPLFISTGKSVTGDQDRMRVAIYKQNLQELDKEFERGLMNSDQLENVKKELELSLLAELEDQNSIPATKDISQIGTNKTTAAFIGILTVVLAISMYWQIGNPQLNELQQLSRQVVSNDEQPPIEDMIKNLVLHLERNPKDGNAWMLLTNMYMTGGQLDNAVNSAEHLYKLVGDDPSVMIIYINALVSANNGQFKGKPTELLEKILAIEPDNNTAMFFSGLAAEEQGDYIVANNNYQKILPLLQNNQVLAQTIIQLISRNEQLIAGNGEVDVEVVEIQSESDAALSISIQVSLSPEFNTQVLPDDTLFVYAQAMQGPPMPLAVVRLRAGDLPVIVALDDSMAMMPALKLSGFDKVKLVARISKSGDAIPKSGDLIGERLEVSVTDSDINKIEINKIVP